MKIKPNLVIFLMLLSMNVMADSPRIVNIINFIREVEPRDFGISKADLFEATSNECQQMRQHHLTGTWLIQYDALIDPRYQQLLKEEAKRGSEIGGWWEITQPHVEAAGMKWRGRYSWDWHANTGFSVGYTPEEREKLVDVYMAKFHDIFGVYPKSVGSWIIDAHTLSYMHDKYGVIASCICRDQMGTDGYTLFGSYWNQAYYPSRKNIFMPAQHSEEQISVPVFRMLGSDPIYQYDAGAGGNGQGVYTLETICYGCGDDERWVKRFFKSVFEDPALGFNYTQAGQENSFSWPRIEKGFKVQMEQISRYRALGTVRVETLAESASWYRSRYKVTPATSFSTLDDTFGKHHKSLWFNSRFYRANLLVSGDTLFFRDIHLFDENMPSDYLTKSTTSTAFEYRTIPVMDGFNWTTASQRAGIFFQRKYDTGSYDNMNITDFKVSTPKAGKQQCSFRADGALFTITFDDNTITIRSNAHFDWHLSFCIPATNKSTLSVEGNRLIGTMKGYGAALSVGKGKIRSGQELCIKPSKHSIVFRTEHPFPSRTSWK